MQGRALGTLLRGGSRDLASLGSLRPAPTIRLQYCAISTTSSLRSPDDSDPRQPSNPRERARAAAESLTGLSGGSTSEQTPLSERINRQFAAPTNVRSLPRRPLEHPGENNGGGGSMSGSGGSSNSGRGGGGPPRLVRPPSSLASRGAIVRAPSTLGRGGGGGLRGGSAGGVFAKLGGDTGGRGGGGGGGGRPGFRGGTRGEECAAGFDNRFSKGSDWTAISCIPGFGVHRLTTNRNHLWCRSDVYEQDCLP
ncbi:hypothetical protein MAPG_00400 [Magnaporthiopsis poae ATCC 64411]|uniref:Uncharacterized protein n=1 Tax=Magnaporthiopsis poae (strain ATCC 64411 / 73-15) TaxID=644358 RepID=A0A0C4DKW8_MAGP6|nr:hypothetical protein MAPG_00400 [Magnaporthiopsis poae ATCC 64411]